MNCDEAFDALTDPAERDNSALAWHLEFCPRCREMREVLAPALSMLAVESDAGESAQEENTSSAAPNRLPGSFSDVESNPRDAGNAQRGFPAPFLTPEAVRVAEQTARTLHPARGPLAAPWFRWIAAGVACMLASLGLFLATASPPPDPQQSSNSMMLADQCLWTERSTDHSAGPPEESSSRWVVLSCVACHLEQSLE